MATRLPKDYAPSDSEPFMNARQREYFRRKLVTWKKISFGKLAKLSLHCKKESSPS